MTDVTQYISNIDPTFPTPGKDNNTQGFRSNFANIQQALSTLNQNLNGIAATTVNINSPKITATQSMTSIGPLYIGTQTFAYVTTVDNKLTVAGLNSSGSPAAGEIAFSPSIISISTNPTSVATDATGTYFVTTSPTIGLLVGGVFYCPSTGTGPFKIINIAGSKIYFTGSGGLDPSVDVVNPVFNKNTVLTTSTVIPFFGQGFPGSIIVASTANSIATTSGSLVVQGGVGIAKNLNVAGTATLANAVIGGDLFITGNLAFGNSTNFVGNFTDVSGNPGSPISGYQKLPGGLYMAWGYAPNVPTRGIKQICFPNFGGTGIGFPNGILNVQITPSILTPVISYYTPVYCSCPGDTIIGRTATTSTITASYGVNNATKQNFVVTYQQNLTSYQSTSPAPYTVRTVTLNTAAVFWSALGF